MKQENLNPFMFKEKFYESMKKFEMYKDLCGKPLKRDWVAIFLFPIQILPIFSKNELLSCLQKVNHVTNYRLVNLTTRSALPNRWVPVRHLVRLYLSHGDNKVGIRLFKP